MCYDVFRSIRCCSSAGPGPHLANDRWNPWLLCVPWSWSWFSDWTIPGGHRSVRVGQDVVSMATWGQQKQDVNTTETTASSPLGWFREAVVLFVFCVFLHVVSGNPAMPIYWALGYHLCRWGLNSSESTWDLVKSMRDYGIPQVKCNQQTVWDQTPSLAGILTGYLFLQDVQWNDIDYMDQFIDFTYDSINFATLPDLVKDLHAHDQRYVIMLVNTTVQLHSCVFLTWLACLWPLFVPLQDPGISSTQPEGSYWPYDEGLRREVFIKNADGNTLIGKVRHKSPVQQ